MNNMNLDILRISETRWKGSGKITKDKYTLIYSGGEDRSNGVGVMIKNTIAKSIVGYWAISDRVLLVKIKGKPFDINIIQVYAPTQGHTDEELEQFYEQVQKAIKSVKSDEVLFVMGDLNAKVGNEQHTNIIGKHGLGDRNDRGERLIQFRERNNLVVTNTFFQHPPRKLYTWKSPGDVTRNKIDCVMISQRFKNSVKQAKICPGADINSDHNPVKVKVLIKLKRTRITSNAEQLDLDMLKQEETRLKYNVAIKNTFEKLHQEQKEQYPEVIQHNNETLESHWTTVKNTLKQHHKKYCQRKA